MSNLNQSKKIIWRWIIANLVGFCASVPFGFAAIWFLSLAFGWSQLDSILYIIFVYGFIGVIIGIAQWLNLKQYFSKISHLWILSNALALPLSIYTFLLVGRNLSNILFPLFGDVIALGILAAIAGGLGGITCGVIQLLVLKKWIFHRHFAITWIFTSFIICIFASFISVVISMLINLPNFPWNWIELAITFAILYSATTGRVLYWFLLHTKHPT